MLQSPAAVQSSSHNAWAAELSQQLPAQLPPRSSLLSWGLPPADRNSPTAINVIRTQCLPCSDSEESDDDEVRLTLMQTLAVLDDAFV